MQPAKWGSSARKCACASFLHVIYSRLAPPCREYCSVQQHSRGRGQARPGGEGIGDSSEEGGRVGGEMNARNGRQIYARTASIENMMPFPLDLPTAPLRGRISNSTSSESRREHSGHPTHPLPPSPHPRAAPHSLSSLASISKWAAMTAAKCPRGPARRAGGCGRGGRRSSNEDLGPEDFGLKFGIKTAKRSVRASTSFYNFTPLPGIPAR